MKSGRHGGGVARSLTHEIIRGFQADDLTGSFGGHGGVGEQLAPGAIAIIALVYTNVPFGKYLHVHLAE